MKVSAITHMHDPHARKAKCSGSHGGKNLTLPAQTADREAVCSP